MSTEIVKINPSEFGLTDETAANIKAQFEPMLAKMVELETEFNAVVSLPIEEPTTSKKAKELRLKYVKVRTGTAEIHKAQKSFYLNGGRFVDGWKNAQLFASQGKEDKLEEIEKYFENKEKERKEQLHLTRVELIREFVEDTTAYQFGEMAQDVFDALLSAKKQAHIDRIEAELKAEKERVAKEKAEAEERERVRVENERLKKAAEQREKEIEVERKAMEEKVQQERAESERKLNEERAKVEAERKRVEAEQAAKLEQERSERAKVEAELKAKQEAELAEKKQREADELKAKKDAEKLAKAPVKKQLKTWVDSFSLPVSPDHELSAQITEKFESFKTWALTQIESI